MDENEKKVYDQVVSMRKCVKQAQIHVLNKCSKQAKFWKNRKGSGAKLEKSKRKFERLLMEINILKKIKPDSISTKALLKEKDWKVLLTEKNVPLEERCFAMLAIHPSVQTAVEKFHSENEDLIPKIALLVKDWDDICLRFNVINKDLEDKKVTNQGGKPKYKRKKIINKPNNDARIGGKPQVENEQLLKSTLDPEKKIVEDGENVQDIRSKLRKISELSIKQLKNPNKRPPKNANPRSNLSSKNCTLVENDELKHSNSDSEGVMSEEELEVKNDNNVINGHQNEKISKDFQNDNYHSEEDPESRIDADLMNLQNASENKRNLTNLRNVSPVKNFNNFSEDDVSEEELEVEKDNHETDGRQNKISQDFLNDIYHSEKDLESSTDRGLMSLQNTNESKHNLTNIHNVSPIKNFKNLNTNYPSFANKLNSENKVKAITQFNLDELQDLDEIPIENSNLDDDEEMVTDTGKQKKDPFFLREGEASDSDDGKRQKSRKRDSTFKKKSFDNFNRRESNNKSFNERKFERRGNKSFPKRQFESEGNKSFPEKKFEKRENKSFPERKFERGGNKSFPKRKFERGGNKSFPERKFEKGGQRSSGFKSSFRENNFHSENPEKNSFKRILKSNNKFDQNKKFKPLTNDQSKGKFNSKVFNGNPKGKTSVQNLHEDSKASNSSSPTFSNYHKKANIDDKPLHPSWEAKRKQKEAANVKFEGKRIVFED
ncbi:uncharacterized protein TNIN_152931 [Trichonephila inaurata madagascariensis]|uniref:Serum response factor-binding protein 1 n=1 Tax=Trichonephila inaurata madagascariensis TaxID=2747483 RepID=A0A8X6WKS9_9ARAC|nr:uncharacterized protein TNIN_152931 [Trichonephila inaurata madagascariensis]